MIRMKICGVRTAADLALCLEAGAKLLGFNFHPKSPRGISPEHAATLTRQVPSDVAKVGVFVDMPAEEIARTCEVAHLTHVQLHGDQDPADFRSLEVKRIQVLRVTSLRMLEAPVSPFADLVLLDAHVPTFGGGGKTFDWQGVAEITARWPVPMVLAGGLTPENVAEAIRVTRPWGVDVASGVESAPGVKDPERVSAFARAVREASEQLERSA